MNNQPNDLESSVKKKEGLKTERKKLLTSVLLTALFFGGVHTCVRYEMKRDKQEAEYETRRELKFLRYSNDSVDKFIKEEREFMKYLAQTPEEYQKKIGENPKTQYELETGYERYLINWDNTLRTTMGVGLYRDEMGRLYTAPLKKKGMH